MQKTKGKKPKTRWAEFTQDDIDKIIQERCTHCGYRGMTGEKLSCDYILQTGHRRGCRPDKCNKFKKGIRVKTIVHPSLSRKKKKKKVSAYVYSSKRLKPPVTHFGKMLDDYMKAHKLVQRDFAELIGYKEDAVSGWRLGKRKPQKKAILAIAKQICVDEEIVRAEIERGLLDEFRSEKKEKEETKEAQSEHYPERGRQAAVLYVHDER